MSPEAIARSDEKVRELKDGLDFRGRWITESDEVVEITDRSPLGHWLGYRPAEGQKKTCVWNPDGRFPGDPSLDLVERIREGAYAKKLF